MAQLIFKNLGHLFDQIQVFVVQFQKGRYPRFQLTELFHLRPEPKKAQPTAGL